MGVRAYSYSMRYSREHKAESHEKIVSMAARSFREHGADSSGIGKVMKKAGLTKGGFYRHFQSKDDLLVEGVTRAFEQMGEGMVAVAEAAPKGQSLRAMIGHYLSMRHAQAPGVGCVAAALGPELARKPVAVRKRIEAALEAYLERLLPYVPGRGREERLIKTRMLFSGMAGVLMMARLASSAERREEMLRQAQVFFAEQFATRE